jgi:hypothetical protein
MTITIELPEVWEQAIAGETFKIFPQKIPVETFVAIVRDRLTNKGKDTWADSTKVTPDRTRQDLWAEALGSVYDGSWCPGTGRGTGQRKKTMTWETFLENASKKEAKRRIGKNGFKGADGYHFMPDDEASLVECTARLVANAKWQSLVKLEWTKLQTIDDLDL